ncbi:dihydrodipicolinate synthetase [Colletotrichum graminicola M1.001]|uniref:Dihydrodipicolinate synthetase n=1 Tax=Colletotrichum graminicola (strain M1.001 / M2 / FGSC 10212) TaxID=645133 RepID=E3QKF8_COLGM|nr:dihydrodipicolinate synthetase [Colletotrichum graminicola M1.001]EFQ31346.1 dihydrodipicolinate synthetase [Colletotrichum graminicola M1.001]
MATPQPAGEPQYGAPKAEHLRLPAGVYVPTLAFFTESDEVDTNTLERHIVRLINAGVAGIVVHGSNGEAVHLSREERSSMIRCAADTIHQEGLDVRIPLVAGCGAQSTRETIQLCRDAGRSGATHALVLPPSYYGPLLGDDRSSATSTTSPTRRPSRCSSTTSPGRRPGWTCRRRVSRIARHPNVVGVKLTCGNTGKLARVADDAPPGFFVAGGSADFILQGQVVGGHGTIAGLANLAPRACVRIVELASRGELAEARRLQAVVARGDWVAIRTGFVGVKAAMGHFEQYGGAPRKPCAAPSPEELKGIVEGLSELLQLERRLEAGGRAGCVH